MPVTDDEKLRELLDARRIAVVGCSATPGKAAHEVPAYTIRAGYEVVPVNPYADEVLGRDAADSLADVAATVDLVNVFRPRDEVPGIVDQTAARRETRGDVRALWLQRGISHDHAATRAEATGLRVVQDRCLKVEHGRLVA
jgi:predicted CoA-binding protein